MANNSLYDGILMPQGGIYEPGAPVMLPPVQSAPAKQSAVVRALIASDPNGPGLRDPQSGMSGGWSQFEDLAGSGTPSLPGVRFASTDKFGSAQDRLSGQVDAQFDPVEAYSGVPRNPGQQAIEAAAPRGGLSPWGPDWTTGIGAVHQPMLLGSPGQFAGGDPWAADRFGGESVVSRPGMVVGAAPVLSPVAQALVQSAPPGNFLQDRGVDVSGMTIGQQANELNKQLAGGSRNADGSRGFM